jgi:hypothetical protein
VYFVLQQFTTCCFWSSYPYLVVFGITLAEFCCSSVLQRYVAMCILLELRNLFSSSSVFAEMKGEVLD